MKKTKKIFVVAYSKSKMADYRPSPWRPYYNGGDPIERCQPALRNYRPHSRYLPHVDPKFYKPCYHASAMPHHHDPRYTHHGVQIPPAMAGYSGFIVPMTSEHPQHASNVHNPRYLPF